MPKFQPSFMATITIKLDNNALILPTELQEAMNAPGMIITQHAKWLKAKFFGEQFQGASRRVWPVSVDLEVAGHMVADTCKLEVMYSHMPIDVTTVKGAVVQIYGGTVTPEGFRKGITELDRDRMVDASSVVSQTHDKAMFTGLADSVSWKGKNGNISFECRDLTQILLDSKIPTSVYNNLPDTDLNLVDWVFALIKTHPVIREYIDLVVSMSNAAGNSDTPPAESSQAFHKTQSFSKKKKSKVRHMPKTFNNISYWDLIVDVCIGAGWIPNVEGTSVVLRNAQTFLGREYWKDVRFSREFDGEVSHVRRFVSGRDITDEELSRDLGGKSVPAIQVVASEAGRTQTAIWPPVDVIKSGSLAFTPNGQEQQQKIVVVPVHGPSDIQTLTRLAQELWEVVKRQEFTGHINTTDIYSYGGDNDDPDLLYMRAGEPIEYIPDSVSKMMDYASVTKTISEERLLRWLEHHDRDDSDNGDTYRRMAVEMLRRAKRQRFYRVKNISHKFTAASGYNCKIEFHNWYEVLWDEVKEKGLKTFKAVANTPAKVSPPEGGVE